MFRLQPAGRPREDWGERGPSPSGADGANGAEPAGTLVSRARPESQVRAGAHRLPARGQRPHRFVQLAVRPQPGGCRGAADRGHRRLAEGPRIRRRHRRAAEMAWHRLGRGALVPVRAGRPVRRGHRPAAGRRGRLLLRPDRPRDRGPGGRGRPARRLPRLVPGPRRPRRPRRGGPLPRPRLRRHRGERPDPGPGLVPQPRLGGLRDPPGRRLGHLPAGQRGGRPPHGHQPRHPRRGPAQHHPR